MQEHGRIKIHHAGRASDSWGFLAGCFGYISYNHLHHGHISGDVKILLAPVMGNTKGNANHETDLPFEDL